MLEQQGKDAPHNESHSLPSFFFYNLLFSLVPARTHTRSLLRGLSGMFMCVVLITRVCVTCERTDMSKPAPGMETR